jgi:hypothetical protein
LFGKIPLPGINMSRAGGIFALMRAAEPSGAGKRIV